MSSFHKVEICTMMDRDNKIGNDAHANWLRWSVQHRRMANFRIMLSHCKTYVTMSDGEAFEYFKKHWPYYNRILY